MTWLSVGFAEEALALLHLPFFFGGGGGGLFFPFFLFFICCCFVLFLLACLFDSVVPECPLHRTRSAFWGKRATATYLLAYARFAYFVVQVWIVYTMGK